MLISLFIGCYNHPPLPEPGRAVVTVLERLGHSVEFREAQTCCGQMHYNTGYAAEALPLMRRLLAGLAGAAAAAPPLRRRMLDVFAGVEVICVPSASCVAMMRDHYPKMAAETGDP